MPLAILERERERETLVGMRLDGSQEQYGAHPFKKNE